jgi:two-component system sensor histidine kinase BaeS
MNIFRKVFLSFLGLTALTLLITLGLARWSFDQGFLNFVGGLEQQRLSLLGETLSNVYSRDGNWQKVINNGLNFYLTPDPLHLDSGPPSFSRPGPLRRQDQPQNTRRPPPRDLGEGAPHTALYDTQGDWLSGNTPDEDALEVLSHDIVVKGQKVGELHSWLGAIKHNSLASSFSQQQRYASLIIGLLCLILAGIASWLLARRLTSPVELVIQGVERLSRGNYDVNLDTLRQDELGTLMRNLNGLSHILNDTRASKNRWFADISHELRTPLTILIGELDALEAGIRPFGPEQIESLKNEALLLHRLVDDLYQLSMSEVGGLRYNFSEIDISKNVENVRSAMQNKAEKKELTISSHIPYPVICLADSQRIEQLFINLLNNAILYTDKGGVIRLSLVQNSTKIIFEINDTTPGVPPADCEKLFDPLYRQSTARNRATPGAGLGLTICKNIVTAHQGIITASQSSLGGLCVTVELDRAKE